MTWDPDQGFHIEAFVDRTRERIPLPDLIELRDKGYVISKDLCTIRMKSQRRFHFALARAPLINRSDILIEERLSIKFARVFFYEPNPLQVDDSNFVGRAVFETGDGYQNSG